MAIKKDYLDITFTMYEVELKDALEYFNVDSFECEMSAKEYYKMIKEKLTVLKFFVSDIYLNSKKEGITKNRHVKKYGHIRDLENTINKCLINHNITQSPFYA